jgi:hypothetical protein
LLCRNRPSKQADEEADGHGDQIKAEGRLESTRGKRVRQPCAVGGNECGDGRHERYNVQGVVPSTNQAIVIRRIKEDEAAQSNTGLDPIPF